MAESDTILQLGIEAAREGNREEARSLFSLLTRQEPDNVQAWLWLAGVAESPEERRAALERVVTLDPSNEMARKGLQALGVDPDAVGRSAAVVAPTISAPTPPPPAPVQDVSLSDEDRYAAELDSAFDDYDTVEKVGGGISNTPTSYRDDDDDAFAAGAAASSARDRVDARRNSRRSLVEDDDEEEYRPARRRPSLVALILGAIILLLLLGLFLPRLFNRNTTTTVGTNSTAAAETTIAGGVPSGSGDATGTTTGEAGGVAGTGNITDIGAVGGTGAVTGTGTVSNTGTTPPPPAAVTPQTQPPVAGNFPDPAGANPQQVPVGTTLQANGFSYNYPNATYAASLGSTVGGNTAQNGRFVVVLVLVANNTGTEQAIPADLFVLKDAQNRIYTTNAAASKAYVQPGINADKSLQDPLPANGVAYSVALVFDVAPDATNLVLFTRPKQDQGFLVLNSVP